MAPRKRVVVFSGGSAANNLIEVFTDLCHQDKHRGLDFVLPISDNGGSTSEIIRVFGGPGIGDVRSRLIRLIPEDRDDPDLEKRAIKNLLNHRLSNDNNVARIEWLEIVEGRHPLWTGITSEKRELIRAYINHINMEIIKRQRPSNIFCFKAASVGNLWLTGARFFTGSFESAIYLFRSITGIPDNISVLPAINSNFAHHIAAGLEDGTVIVGQNQISHPSPTPTVLPSVLSSEEEDDNREEDANPPESLKALRNQNIEFSKEDENELSSRIDRIWYINTYGQEIRPPANPRVIESIKNSEAIIYSIGSLYTSLVPCLVLRNMGNTILQKNGVPKILLLNGSHDRETSPDHDTFTAITFIEAIVRACTNCATVEPKYYRRFVTHVIYMDGNGAPKVDAELLKKIGIQATVIAGRRHPGGDGKGKLYDAPALGKQLTAILGKSKKKVPGQASRRNTIDGSLQLMSLSDGTVSPGPKSPVKQP